MGDGLGVACGWFGGPCGGPGGSPGGISRTHGIQAPDKRHTAIWFHRVLFWFHLLFIMYVVLFLKSQGTIKSGQGIYGSNYVRFWFIDIKGGTIESPHSAFLNLHNPYLYLGICR